MSIRASGNAPSEPAGKPLGIEAWNHTWRALGVEPPAAEIHDRLLAAHREPHRAYHTLEHLTECFDHLRALRHHSERPAEIELALWFHDAIYATRRSDNEERSADRAEDVARDAGLPADVVDRVRAMILATRHEAEPANADQQVMLDADLGILGASPERFNAYEAQVRQEYRWVPSILYRRRRRAILQSFLDRPSIYATDTFRDDREARARENLARAIEQL